MTHLSQSRATLVWTGQFAVHHLPLILGLGAVAGAERALTQLWGAPGPLPLLLEALAWASRVALVVTVVRIGILADERYRRDRVDERLTRFLRDHWPSWVVNGAVLMLAFAVFSLPELWGNTLNGAERSLFFAVLLAAKNLTVIPLTLLWLTGIGRQAVLYEPEWTTRPSDSASATA